MEFRLAAVSGNDTKCKNSFKKDGKRYVNINSY